MFKKAKSMISLCRKNLPVILSWMAVGGVALTGYLAHKAAKEEGEGMEKYLPSVIAGAGTIFCILGANRIHMNREAALTAAVAFYKAAGEEFEEAVENRFGEDGKKAKLAPAFSSPSGPPMKIRIWEPYTKQWFEATQQEILWAELTANKMLQQKGTVTLNEVLQLYSDKNLKMKKIGEKLGWSWEDETFMEGSGYYYAGGWIDMCPQFDDRNGDVRFVMDYGINPNDISEIV